MGSLIELLVISTSKHFCRYVVQHSWPLGNMGGRRCVGGLGMPALLPFENLHINCSRALPIWGSTSVGSTNPRYTTVILTIGKKAAYKWFRQFKPVLFKGQLCRTSEYCMPVCLYFNILQITFEKKRLVSMPEWKSLAQDTAWYSVQVFLNRLHHLILILSQASVNIND